MRSISRTGRQHIERRPVRTARVVGAAPSQAFQNVDAIAGVIAISGLICTSLFGTFGALGFILAAMAMFAVNPLVNAKDLAKFSPLFALSVLAILSTFWSDAPERTLRAALQLMITTAAAIVVCRRIRPELLIAALFVGFVVIVALTTPGIPQALSTGSALGSILLGSKNQVGFAAQALIALSLTVAVDRQQPSLLRWATLPAATLALLILVLSRSAGAWTTTAACMILLPGLLVLGKLPPRGRIAAAVAIVAILAIVLILLPDILAAWADFQQHVLKKDTTLTGRTYLWDVAAKLSDERPLLGHGYYAFWREGNIDAEGLWRWGGIASRSGFNFHNAFIEMRVDMGLIGQVVLVASCIVIFALGLWRQLVRPTIPIAFLLSYIFILYVRSFTETGLIAPFSIVMVLWLALGIYSVERPPLSSITETDPGFARGRRKLSARTFTN